jgi:DNA adenine methylase
MIRLPHPIPYQGSKRSLSLVIGNYIPREIETFYEPFAGSAAMTIWAAHNGIARRYVIGDVLFPIADLWKAILTNPSKTADRYEVIWKGQADGGPDYFNLVRERYNCSRDPVDILYLICRCVKNAVRFNRQHKFTQSVDRRRLGMRPDKMRQAMHGAAFILRGRVEVRAGDWLETLSDITCKDFAYLDPPYLGTTIGRDKRYAEGLQRARLLEGLDMLGGKGVPFALSYDGMTGGREYGPPLPSHLGLTRLLLRAGRSSQATLSGRDEETVESLYLSNDLMKKVERVSNFQHQASFAI